MNDAIENLQPMTRAEHMKHHEPERRSLQMASMKQAGITRSKNHREKMMAIWDKYYWEFEAEADQELEESYVRPG